jgi:hypothetical protein
MRKLRELWHCSICHSGNGRCCYRCERPEDRNGS